jgi:hypothetical protein
MLNSVLPEALSAVYEKRANQTDWFRPRSFDSIHASLSDSHYSLIRALRCYSIFHTFLLPRNCPLIDERALSDNFPDAPISEIHHHLDYTFCSRVASNITLLFEDPYRLAQSIVQAFASDNSDLFVFAHITFPALYSYFYVADFLQTVADMILHLIRLDSGPIVSHFVCAFFQYPIDFCDLLIRDYAAGIGSLARPQTAVSCFRCFARALAVAAKKLTRFHFDIARSIAKRSHQVFASVFISDFLSQMIGVWFPSSPLLDALDFTVRNIESASFWWIFTALCVPVTVSTDEMDLIGGYSTLTLKTGFAIAISLPEVSTLARVLGIGEVQVRARDSSASSSWRPMRLTAFPRKARVKFSDPLSILPPIRRPKFPALRDQFGACYGALLNCSLSAIAFRDFAARSDLLLSPKFIHFFELMRDKLACHRMKLLSRMLTARQLCERQRQWLVNIDRVREAFLREIARRHSFTGSEFLSRRALLTFAVPTVPGLVELVRDVEEKCVSEKPLTKVEAELTVLMNRALAKKWIGERIVGIAGVVELALGVFGNEIDAPLWNVVCNSRKELLLTSVFMFFKRFSGWDMSLHFNAEIMSLMHPVIRCLEKPVWDRNSELENRFTLMCLT